jgi:serine protease Do
MRAYILSVILYAYVCSSGSALAQTTYLKISAGTGFFVNKLGHIITNAHVVRGCQSINILTQAGERSATLISSDSTHDLALLKVSDMGGSSVAPMRWNIRDLKIGDSVNLVGFPGQEGANGRYSYKKTNVSSLEGPTGEPVWIQLNSVAQKGNSGGPVIDGTGNVIAVISGVAQTYRIAQDGRPESNSIGQSDIAITLPTLQDFLHKNAVPYYESASGLVSYADVALETNTLKFVVPVRCVQGSITQ